MIRISQIGDLCFSYYHHILFVIDAKKKTYQRVQVWCFTDQLKRDIFWDASSFFHLKIRFYEVHS